MRWFKFYPDDYLKGVRGLTAEEAGVYMALMALMYQEGGAIPDDEAWICGAARIKTRAWHRIRDRLCRLGKIIPDADGFLANRRVLDEVEKAQNFSETHRKLSQKGGVNSAKSRAENKENNDVTEPAVEPTVNHIEKKNKRKRYTPPSEVSGFAAPKPLIPFPENWTPSDGLRTFATKIGFTDAEFEAAANDFREYWAERPLERRTAGGWSITFQKNLKAIATSDSLRKQLRLVSIDGSSLGQPTSEERSAILDRLLGKRSDANG